jgi:hypothetical protein
MTKGEESTSRALMIPFLAIHAKGGESKSPKAKGPHHHQIQKLRVFKFSKEFYQLVSYCVQKAKFKNFVFSSFQKNFINWYLIVFKRGRK